MIMNEMEPGTGAVWRPQAVPAGRHQVASWDIITAVLLNTQQVAALDQV